MQIDTDDDCVFIASLTVEQIRESSDDSIMEALAGPLDDGQAYVFTERGKKAYVIIEITANNGAT
jgi:hypothetical protein